MRTTIHIKPAIFDALAKISTPKETADQVIDNMNGNTIAHSDTDGEIILIDIYDAKGNEITLFRGE